MAFTKVTGPGIHTLANITSHNINSSGIITATKFVGPLEASSGSTGTFDSLTVTGNVSVGGTLTYEDVTNIDSVGIVTAQNGLRVTAGGINVTAGISTFGGAIDANGALDVDGQTDLDVLNVAETATFSALVDVNNRLDVVGGATVDQLNVTGVSTFASDIVIPDKIVHSGDGDTAIRFPDNNIISFERAGGEALRITTANALLTAGVTAEPLYPHYVTARKIQAEIKGALDVGQTRHHGSLAVNCTNSNSFIGLTRSDNTQTDGTGIGVLGWSGFDGTDYHQAAAIEVVKGAGAGNDDQPGHMIFKTNAGTTSATERLRIKSDGNVNIAQTLNVTGVSTFAGNIDANGTLDVDGDTQLDDLNVAGVTTFSDSVRIVKTAGPLLELTTNTGAADATLRLSEGATGSTTNGGGMFYSGADNKLHITCGTNSTTKRISILRDTGLVGIATDTPQTLLHLKSDDPTLRIQRYNQSAYGDITADTAGKMVFKSDPGGSASGDGFSFTIDNSEKFNIDSDGNVSIASSLAVTGVTTSSSYDLSAIDKSIADTAVDIFVYDTRKDSDGGAWRKRTSHTTWYNETFDSKRGSKKEFPAVAVIVAETDKLTIYDGDKPEMPMWMVFDSGGANGNHMTGRSNEDTTSIHMLNGLLCVGRDYFGIHMINFIDDRARFKENGYDTPYILPIGTHRNGGNAWALNPTNEGNDLRNDLVSDIAMTVLPNAPIDASTGLPIPTIAVATDQGVSVITTTDATTWENGNVWDVYMGNATYDTVNNVQFTKDGKVVYTDHNGSQYGWMYVHDIPYQDTAITVNTQSTALSWYDTRDAGSESAQGGHSFADQDGHIYSSTAGYGVKILHAVTGPDDMIYTSTTSGVTMIQENRGENRSGLVAHITHNHNTGWLHGDQKFCLSDTDDTDKTNTQTEYDRSIGAKNLTVHGTVTKTAVATGAEMVSWSFGNSNSNYLKQDYTAKLQFGTGDFSIMGWIKMPDYSDGGYVLDRADSSTGNRFAVFMSGDDLVLYTNDGSTTEVGSSAGVVIGEQYDGKWVSFVVTRHSSGLMEGYINGKLRQSIVGTSRNVDNDDAYLIVGGRHNNASGEHFNGDIALLRMSKSVPSPEQVAKMYNDEKDLFIDNAKCTLYGSSSSITALAHDEDTDTLHVGTSGGRSDFTGLNRINNTTTAVTTVISASNGLIIEQ